MAKRSSILISGWRMLPHSYALVNQFQCLELLRRPELQLYFEDLPYYNPQWQPVRGVFPATDEQAILTIPTMPAGMTPDAELRIVYPYDLIRPPRSRRTCTFGTAEYRVVPPQDIADRTPLAQAHLLHDRGIVILTPSNWSRAGFIHSGADPNRVAVVPHGVDMSIFHAPTREQRAAVRGELGVEQDEFVFLVVGAMTDNKNLPMILRTFASVLGRYPRARLLLKGLDGLYPSQQLVADTIRQTLGRQANAQFASRLIYLGRTMTFNRMASLYHASDCYLSPYLAEGFNMPALEAAACGLPLICTAGGPTDDFVTDAFAHRIRSQVSTLPQASSGLGVEAFALLPDEPHLQQLAHAVIEDQAFRTQASKEGPAHVAAHFTWKHVVDKLLAVLLPQ